MLVIHGLLKQVIKNGKDKPENKSDTHKFDFSI